MIVSELEIAHGPYLISTDRDRVDLDTVHRYLSEESYWARGRTKDVQRRAIEMSPVVIGAYFEDRQVGFARMVTDFAAFGYLCDVFVLSNHQGSGLGTAMVKAIVEHPDVIELQWQLLATDDAHGLYSKFGYTPLVEVTRWMLRSRSSVHVHGV